MIKLRVTRGFGNGTFNGAISMVSTHGYSIGEAIIRTLLPATRATLGIRVGF